MERFRPHEHAPIPHPSRWHVVTGGGCCLHRCTPTHPERNDRHQVASSTPVVLGMDIEHCSRRRRREDNTFRPPTPTLRRYHISKFVRVLLAGQQVSRELGIGARIGTLQWRKSSVSGISCGSDGNGGGDGDGVECGGDGGRARD